MKAIIAKAAVPSGKEAEFEQIALELVKQVRAHEPGNKLYRLCRSSEGDYFFIELFENGEAIAAHRDAPHMKEAGARFIALMGGMPEVTILDVLED